jgi:hypothetical protein
MVDRMTEELTRVRSESPFTNRTLLKAYRHLYQIAIDRDRPYKVDKIDNVQRALLYDEDIDDCVLDNYEPSMFTTLFEGFVPIVIMYDDRRDFYFDATIIDTYLQCLPNLEGVTARTLHALYDENPDDVIANLHSTLIGISNKTHAIDIEFIIKLFSDHHEFMPRIIEGRIKEHRELPPSIIENHWKTLHRFVETRAMERIEKPTLIRAYLERKKAKATIWECWKRARYDPRYKICRTRLLYDMENIEASIPNKRQCHDI